MWKFFQQIEYNQIISVVCKATKPCCYFSKLEVASSINFSGVTDFASVKSRKVQFVVAGTCHV